MPKDTRLHDLMQGLVSQIVDRGIYWREAAAEFEKQFIATSLRKAGGSIHVASRSMGIHRNTLSRKMALYRISKYKI